jgi:hypothetical protein
MTYAEMTGGEHEPERADDPHDSLGLPLLRRGRAHGTPATELRDLRAQRIQFRVSARGLAAVRLGGAAGCGTRDLQGDLDLDVAHFGFDRDDEALHVQGADQHVASDEQHRRREIRWEASFGE